MAAMVSVSSILVAAKPKDGGALFMMEGFD
jgi:hypothetical protein